MFKPARKTPKFFDRFADVRATGRPVYMNSDFGICTTTVRIMEDYLYMRCKQAFKERKMDKWRKVKS
jgi:hypothetical protein